MDDVVSCFFAKGVFVVALRAPPRFERSVSALRRALSGVGGMIEATISRNRRARGARDGASRRRRTSSFGASRWVFAITTVVRNYGRSSLVPRRASTTTTSTAVANLNRLSMCTSGATLALTPSLSS